MYSRYYVSCENVHINMQCRLPDKMVIQAEHEAKALQIMLMAQSSYCTVTAVKATYNQFDELVGEEPVGGQ